MQQKHKKQKTEDVECFNLLFTEKDMQQFVFSRTMKQLESHMIHFSDELQMKIMKMKLEQARTTQNFMDIISCTLERKGSHTKQITMFLEKCKEFKKLDVYKQTLDIMVTKHSCCLKVALDISPFENYEINARNVPSIEGMHVALQHPNVHITPDAYWLYLRDRLFNSDSIADGLLDIFEHRDLSIVPGLIEKISKFKFSNNYIKRNPKIHLIALQFPENRLTSPTWSVKYMNVSKLFKFMTAALQTQIETFMPFPKDLEKMLIVKFVELFLNNKNVGCKNVSDK